MDVVLGLAVLPLIGLGFFVYALYVIFTTKGCRALWYRARRDVPGGRGLAPLMTIFFGPDSRSWRVYAVVSGGATIVVALGFIGLAVVLIVTSV